jgi:DNA-binding NtrC family response regulator
LTGTLSEQVEAFERRILVEELKRHDYRMAETARALGLERSHLYKKCQHHDIALRDSRHPGEPPR